MPHLRLFLIIIIGISTSVLSHAQEQIDEQSPDGLVIVEPNNIIESKVDEELPFVMKPYLDRRPEWGYTFGLEYNSYEPINYVPNFIATEIATFDELYGYAETPAIGAIFSFKKNMSFGSVGMEASIGRYENMADNGDLADSVLTVYPVRIGFTAALDALSVEPFFVPYASAGAYMMFYREDADNTSISGNSAAAPYLTGGVAFMIDWLDREAAMLAYKDAGVQATYVFIEAQKFFSSGQDERRDFSNDVSWSAGIKIEL
jgi:hypothetical protein